MAEKVKAQISGSGRTEEIFDVDAYHNTDQFSLGIDSTDGRLHVYINGQKQGRGVDVGG